MGNCPAFPADFQLGIARNGGGPCFFGIRNDVVTRCCQKTTWMIGCGNIEGQKIDCWFCIDRGNCDLLFAALTPDCIRGYPI
ncbi:hypothetical protein Pan110_42910 [Gimesia panareensis]|nr:hypothetical protein Pan110_42910 [Gimesia panareensis]